ARRSASWWMNWRSLSSTVSRKIPRRKPLIIFLQHGRRADCRPAFVESVGPQNQSARDPWIFPPFFLFAIKIINADAVNAAPIAQQFDRLWIDDRSKIESKLPAFRPRGFKA